MRDRLDWALIHLGEFGDGVDRGRGGRADGARRPAVLLGRGGRHSAVWLDIVGARRGRIPIGGQGMIPAVDSDANDLAS